MLPFVLPGWRGIFEEEERRKSEDTAPRRTRPRLQISSAS